MAPHYPGSKSEAISASGTLKRPRRRPRSLPPAMHEFNCRTLVLSTLRGRFPPPVWRGAPRPIVRKEKQMAEPAHLRRPSGHSLRSRAPLGYQWVRQCWILGQRYGDAKKADREYALMSAAQAPLIGGLLILVFHGCDPYSGALMFCLTISALWFGIFSSVREIVAEYAVYQRERLLGLSVSAYVFSKIPLLCVVSFAQSVVLLALVFPVLASDRTAATGENLLRVAAMLGILTLTAAGGVALGLALSALALIDRKSVV